VLGQGTFTTGASGTTGTTMHSPVQVALDSGSGALYVADSANHRVLYFSPFPSASGVTATFALGQANLISAAVSSSNTGLDGPYGVSVGLGYVAVADTTNNRVLIYNGAPGANGPAANVVLGQAGFGTSGTNCTSSGMNSPQGV